MVEPNPLTFEQLHRNYRSIAGVQTLNVAISFCPGKIGKYNQMDTSKGCTMSRGLELAINLKSFDELTVPSKTLPMLWAWLWPLGRIDVLAIDVEGMEHIVLGRPLPHPRPRFILFETSTRHTVLPEKQSCMHCTHGSK